MTKEPEANADRTYQIGTVSTLTGIDPHTIRAWERRYEAIVPERTATGRRLYDDETVERLQLLKALVDCNESIGTIASLPDAKLRSRLERLAALGGHQDSVGAEAPDARHPRRVALLAPGLAVQLREHAGAMPEFELVFSENDRESFLEAARREPSDIVILELDAVGPSPLGFVQACRSLPGAPLVLILYHFAQRTSLARLARSGASLVQSPLRIEQVRRVLLDQMMIERARLGRVAAQPAPPAPVVFTSDPAAAPTRRFDDEQLARLFETTSSIDCECPNHLSALVSALVSFEKYSRTCEARDEADAQLHRSLEAGTGEARARLEVLLADLCEHEGISV